MLAPIESPALLDNIRVKGIFQRSAATMWWGSMPSRHEDAGGALTQLGNHSCADVGELDYQGKERRPLDPDHNLCVFNVTITRYSCRLNAYSASICALKDTI